MQFGFWLEAFGSILLPENSMSFSNGGFLSPDGKCKTFDSLANGYVRSEGCGIVVLRKLSDAVKLKDRIYGVIRSTNVNQDGPSSALTAPNGTAQARLIGKNLEARRRATP